MADQFIDDNGVTNFIGDDAVTLWVDDAGVYLGDTSDGGSNQVLLGQICMSLLLALLPLV